jgi:hypothetical protein
MKKLILFLLPIYLCTATPAAFAGESIGTEIQTVRVNAENEVIGLANRVENCTSYTNCTGFLILGAGAVGVAGTLMVAGAATVGGVAALGLAFGSIAGAGKMFLSSQEQYRSPRYFEYVSYPSDPRVVQNSKATGSQATSGSSALPLPPPVAPAK